jgi:ligand-binding SRPBCC domain-containing protein
MFVKFNSIEPLGEGSRADFTLWLGPLPIRWVAVHSGVKPLEGFTDTQVEGPFSTWVHEHKFRRLSDERTLIIDRVQGQPSDHLFWGIISRFMWLTLPFLFFYRAMQTRKSVQSK